MSRGTVNKVIILGRLGADPEVRYMANGNAVTNLRVATNDGYKDKQTGQFVESTEWHRVVLFNRTAENAGQYLKKGRLVYIEGRIRTNKWQDQAGQDRYTTEIVAVEVQFIGGNNAGESRGEGSSPFDAGEVQRDAESRSHAGEVRRDAESHSHAGGSRSHTEGSSPFDEASTVQRNAEPKKNQAGSAAQRQPVPAPNAADFDKFDGDDEIPF